MAQDSQHRRRETVVSDHIPTAVRADSLPLSARDGHLTLAGGDPTIVAMTRNAQSRACGSALVALALGTLLACGGAPLLSPVASVSKPTVVIQAPVSGSQVALGSNVTVSGTASDLVGIDQVILFADGVSVANTVSGQPQPIVPFSLTWTATVAGPHMLQVFAYRADGTPSDPASVQVTLGPAGSGGTIGSVVPTAAVGASIVPTVPVAFTPQPTPMPPQTPPTTTGPSIMPTVPPIPTPTAAPATPVLVPTPTPVPVPTIPPDGRAADDSVIEPHLITLSDCAVQVCPAGVLAMGSITEQISAPEGDIKDQLYFVPEASRSYKIELTSCSDVSDGTAWKPTLSTDTMITGCGDWLVLQFSSSPPAQSMIDVTYAAVSGQMYNSYVYTVYLLDQ